MSWLPVPIRRPSLPAVRETVVPDRLRSQPLPYTLRQRPMLPPSNDIPLGFWLSQDETGDWRQHWMRYTPQHQKSFITIVPARGGKTIYQLAYELGLYGGMINGVAPSVVVNDKKGELLALVGRARYMLGDRVYKIDPHGIVAPSPYVIDARLNVLDGLTPHDTTEIMTIAAGLIVAQGHDPHWFERPRQLVSCLLAHMVDDNNEPACLPYLMTLLGLPDAELTAYMERLATESPIAFVRQYAGPFTATDSREVKGIVSSAIGQLGFLSDSKIAAVMSGRSSFQWRDLKQGGISVFFCLPEKVATTFPRYTRVFWTSALNALYELPYHPCLLVIDEAANSLESSMQLFEHAFNLGPGFGLRLHLLFQNLPQLHGLFQEQSESIISATGVLQMARPNDRTTARYIAERSGRTTFSMLQETNSFSINYGDNGKESSGMNTSYATQYYDRPRWTEQQAYEIPGNQQMLFFEGFGAPVMAYRQPYWLSPWKDRFDKNPMVPGGH